MAMVAAAVLAMAGALTGAVAGVLGDGALLPSLRQEPPYDISARTAPHGRVVLTFASAVGNIGDGPLILNGRRSPGARTMKVTQEVVHADGTRTQVPVQGAMRYTPWGHNHWHWLDFDAFELHDPTTGQSVAQGHKIGFCLGSRYPVPVPVQGAVSTPRINTNCGRFITDATRMRMGIEVGFADDYAAYLEFQFIDITTVPPGRYVVVHHADPHQRLMVADRSAEVAATLIEIGPGAAAGHAPTVTTLASCAGVDGGPTQPCVPGAAAS